LDVLGTVNGTDLRADGYVYVGNELFITDNLQHLGDTDTKFAFTADDIDMIVGGVTMIDLHEDGTQDTIDIGDGSDIDTTINGSKLIVNATTAFRPSSATLISAGTGITVTKSIMRVEGNGAPVSITLDPQIVTTGVEDGQFVILKGTSVANGVTLIDGNGLNLSSGLSFTIGNGDTMVLIYDELDSEWIEVSRSNK